MADLGVEKDVFTDQVHKIVNTFVRLAIGERRKALPRIMSGIIVHHPQACTDIGRKIGPC